MEKGSWGRRCCLGEADGEQLELDMHIWQSRARGETDNHGASGHHTQVTGLWLCPGSVSHQRLMLPFQVEFGEGMDGSPVAHPSAGIYPLGFRLCRAEGVPRWRSCSLFLHLHTCK